MRIIVPIKQVPESSNVKMDPITGIMIRSGVEAIINPLDLYALEAALCLKQELNAQISVISMGPQKAEDALRECLALGCDDAVLLCSKDFRGSDTCATSYTLSQGIKKMGDFQFIVCGERAIDGETGQVGPGIAAFMGLPLITYVRKIYDIDGTSARFERLVESGVEILRSELPAVITVVKDIGKPRLPTLRGVKNSKNKQINVWGPNEIDANQDWIGLNGSPTRVVKTKATKLVRKGKVVVAKTPDEIDDAAYKLIQYLKEKNLLKLN